MFGVAVFKYPSVVIIFALILQLALFGCQRESAGPADEAIDNEALQLRDLGIAELENERPERAEPLFRELAERYPADPLGAVNLAIALLRQQKLDEAEASITALLESAPSAPLFAVRAEIRIARNELDAALDDLARALVLAPDDSEIGYAAFNLASQSSTGQAGTEQAAVVSRAALLQLSRLRPDNPWVLLKALQVALEDGDRATASSRFLRLRELSWQFDPASRQVLAVVGEGLVNNKLEPLRGEVIRLENLLRSSGLYQQALSDLRIGIRGIPLTRFANEADQRSFEPIADIPFKFHPVDQRAGLPTALAVGDLDGDQVPDLLRVLAATAEASPRLEVRLAASAFQTSTEYPLNDSATDGITPLLLNDMSNDGQQDVLVFGSWGAAAFQGARGGRLLRVPNDVGLLEVNAAAAVQLDFDIEGDLDIALVSAGSHKPDLRRNNLINELEPLGEHVFAQVESDYSGVMALLASDLDRDGDIDLLLAHAAGLSWLDNLRQGEFADRSAAAGLAAEPGISAVAVADMDNDGAVDVVVAASEGLQLWLNREARFPADDRVGLGVSPVGVRVIVIGDFNNDGRKDLALGHESGVKLLLQDADQRYLALDILDLAAPVTALQASDLNNDGLLDLVVSGQSGLGWLENQDQTGNGWLSLNLQGLTEGNSKNNRFGIGSMVDIRNGDLQQRYDVSSATTHIGLGPHTQAEVLRVEWTNGVPQNRLGLERNQRVVEEQVLKGSCPFLYAWNGESFGFVTDLLWGSPIGLPVAPGVWLPADPSELVRIDGLVARDGSYDIRITEELWEAAFFDHVSLWVVDHPADVEVASNLRIIPGQSLGEEVLGSRELMPLAQALDGQGRDLTEQVAERDEVYAQAYSPGPYQGVAKDPWSLVMDLGSAPAAPVRLHLEGWIFPSDASLNLAVAQRQDLPNLPPRIEVEIDGRWQPLLKNAGFPAGKTKTTVIDLPAIPAGAQRLRMVSNLWLHWDRIRWTITNADESAQIVSKLLPGSAELRERGYSQLVRTAPNAPHTYDYSQVDTQSPWLPMPGNYTRYGDVLPLLLEVDDFSVILAAGDEIDIRFDASGLAPVAPGYRRTLFLESHGWDKDADRNTFEAQQMEPLPFRAMSGYPGQPGEAFPDTPDYRAYREQWLTREVR
jgi:hypothetical protein